MANKRRQIVNAIAELIKTNLTGNSPYLTDIYDNVKARSIFWDEVADYPYICVYSGQEIREYLPGDFKWAFLTVNIRIYVNEEDSEEKLEDIFQDVETLLDANNDLVVDGVDLATDIRILSLSTDEGLLDPLGVGEITLEIRYEVM